MKKILVSLSLFALLLAPALSAQTYDKDLVVKTMRANMGLLGGVKGDLGASKLVDAADKFYAFAKGMSAILPFTPPKGTKTEWDRVIGAFVASSLKGVAASLAGDKVRALAAVDELANGMKEGHGMFR